jgi:hypothetical protein
MKISNALVFIIGKNENKMPYGAKTYLGLNPYDLTI